MPRDDGAVGGAVPLHPLPAEATAATATTANAATEAETEATTSSLPPAPPAVSERQKTGGARPARALGLKKSGAAAEEREAKRRERLRRNEERRERLRLQREKREREQREEREKREREQREKKEREQKERGGADHNSESGHESAAGFGGKMEVKSEGGNEDWGEADTDNDDEEEEQEEEQEKDAWSEGSAWGDMDAAGEAEQQQDEQQQLQQQQRQAAGSAVLEAQKAVSEQDDSDGWGSAGWDDDDDDGGDVDGDADGGGEKALAQSGSLLQDAGTTHDHQDGNHSDDDGDTNGTGTPSASRAVAPAAGRAQGNTGAESHTPPQQTQQRPAAKAGGMTLTRKKKPTKRAGDARAGSETAKGKAVHGKDAPGAAEERATAAVASTHDTSANDDGDGSGDGGQGGAAVLDELDLFANLGMDADVPSARATEQSIPAPHAAATKADLAPASNGSSGHANDDKGDNKHGGGTALPSRLTAGPINVASMMADFDAWDSDGTEASIPHPQLAMDHSMGAPDSHGESDADGWGSDDIDW